METWTIILTQFLSGEARGSIRIAKEATVKQLRSQVQSMLGDSSVVLFHGDCELRHDELAMSSAGISDGSEVFLLARQPPEGTFRAQYHGNGCRAEGPYRVGFNYTATVTVAFDGMGGCHVNILEEGGMAGDEVQEYKCAVSFVEHDKLELSVVRARNGLCLADMGKDWGDCGGMCFFCVMASNQGGIILDLSVLGSFGPECHLERVTTPHAAASL